MILNLLPWRGIGRWRQRQQWLGGIGLALLLVSALLLGRVLVLQRCVDLQGLIHERAESVAQLRRQNEMLSLILERQQRSLSELRRQQARQSLFSCQERWLSALGKKLPEGAQLEKVSVSNGNWTLVINLSSALRLTVLLKALASLAELQQVNVRQLSSGGDLAGIRLELTGALVCG